MRDRDRTSGSIIVIDGDCDVCSRWVRFLMARAAAAPDERQRFLA